MASDTEQEQTVTPFGVADTDVLLAYAEAQVLGVTKACFEASRPTAGGEPLLSGSHIPFAVRDMNIGADANHIVEAEGLDQILTQSVVTEAAVGQHGHPAGQRLMRAVQHPVLLLAPLVLASSLGTVIHTRRVKQPCFATIFSARVAQPSWSR